jgi:hypothetical protein
MLSIMARDGAVRQRLNCGKPVWRLSRFGSKHSANTFAKSPDTISMNMLAFEQQLGERR